MRDSGAGRHTTRAEHMPSSHRRFVDWTVERSRREAVAIGPSVHPLCQMIIEHRLHPEQGFRACLGIVRLAKGFGCSATIKMIEPIRARAEGRA